MGKQYRVGALQAGYATIRDRLTEIARNPLGLFGRRGEPETTFWALRGVSFDVKAGGVVGIIGRNGAGKSTLLKILSRITEPSEGGADIYGRVGSLLEVGTGFHPELTGRENAYLNGAILGMGRSEIARKFDEIVSFAEVEKFIDTPVKFYSSGMYMRLAFAVAAHLEPEILIVDEVLAVGDATFQKKCLGKMGDVARGGRTVLFVSHNIQAVQTLCHTVVHLRAGAVVAHGPTEEIVSVYVRDSDGRGRAAGEGQRLGPDLELCAMALSPGTPRLGESATLSIRLRALEDLTLESWAVLIHSITDVRVAIIDLRSEQGALRAKAGQIVSVVVDVARIDLVEGEYKLGLYIKTRMTTGNFPELGVFEVAPPEANRAVVPFDALYRGYVELPTAPPRIDVLDETAPGRPG
jgi:ABC-type polysaccharide/polyol phosphate transport system ATPase subunit